MNFEEYVTYDATGLAERPSRCRFGRGEATRDAQRNAALRLVAVSHNFAGSW